MNFGKTMCRSLADLLQAAADSVRLRRRLPVAMRVFRFPRKAASALVESVPLGGKFSDDGGCVQPFSAPFQNPSFTENNTFSAHCLKYANWRPDF